MATERLVYLPLGGAGEIGMNCYVYGYGPADNERLLVVDLGVTFPDMDTTPGVDLILPDISWLAERADRIDGIVITHAHEDHIGALARLWDDLRAPVYARAFTAHLARLKMEEAGLDTSAVKTIPPFPETFNAGPFRLAFLPVSHSIPESAGLRIETPAARVIHSGDFKLDLSPVVGEPFDAGLWGKAAEGGVQALICDSTNVFVPHPGRSEASLAPELDKLIGAQPGLVAATTFASNIARLKMLAEAGARAGRSIVLLGRAMRRMVEAGLETGVLSDFPATISPEDAASVPRDHLMLLTTGSQGERRAATAQLSRGKYLGLELKEGDTFLFSSKTIPGNERSVTRIINNLSEMGVEVIDDATDLYHVSGHANRPDLQQMHALIAPRMVIPMHGEHRHLRAHARLAEDGGFAAAIAPNGTMLELSGDTPRIVDRIETGRVYLDGRVKVGALDGVIRDRIRMALNGHVVVTVILDEDDAPAGEPWCEIIGLSETGRSNASLADVLEADLDQFLGRAGAKTLRDDDKLEEGLRRIVRQSAMDEIGKKPEVTVVISRLA
jgi:ribonuclease J